MLAPMPFRTFDTLGGATAWCERWLRLEATRPVRLAAVFDIDATLLADDRRIEEVCDLFHLCRTLHIAPFCVTARSEEGRRYTEEQLRRLGLDGCKRLFMHPANVRCDRHGAGREKLRSRRRIEKHGFTICFNAGDAPTDHLHPVDRHAFDPDGTHVFVTEDGVAHLKLPG